MKRFHIIFGLIVVVVFLLTGQFMDRVHHHLQFMADGPRMLYRTRHIFILLSGLLNLGIGSYFRYRLHPWLRAVQVIGSLMITISAVLFTIAFFYEPGLSGLQTPLSLISMILISVGTLLHLLSGIKEKRHNYL
jgi:hypothetical protein